MRRSVVLSLGLAAIVGVVAWRLWRHHQERLVTGSRPPQVVRTSPENHKRALREIYLTVRLRPGVRAETLRYLNEVTKPAVIVAASGTDLHTIISEHYGTVTPLVRETVIAANKDAISDETNPRLVADRLTLPVAPRVSGPKTLRVNFSGTLRQFVEITLGNNGDITKDTIVKENPQLADKWDSPLNGSIRLPYTTHYSSYALRTHSLAEARKIARNVKSRDPAVILAEAGYGFEVAPNWSLSSIPSQPITTLNTRPLTLPPKWPFQSLPDKLTDLEESTLPRWSLIAIVDTGIAVGTDRILPLWANQIIGEGGGQGSYSDVCQNDLYGCNFLDPSALPIDDCDVPTEYHHGTHIAGLVSGRLYAGSQELDRLIKVMILKAADNQAQLMPGDINNALIYAISHSANIINLSLTGPHDDAIDNTIIAAPTFLFVAAAGNPTSGVGADLSDPNVSADTGYPAQLSKDHKNVIGVASADADGKLSVFSNYGSGVIDLVSPGEQVPSIVTSLENRSLSGTSQATALVSLTAGILYSQGITAPKDIKNRILASADFRDALRGKVTSEGSLNINKALRFKQDLVQFKSDGHIEEGELSTPTKLEVQYHGTTVPVFLRRNLFKITPNYSNEPGKEIRVMFLLKGSVVSGYISSLGTISFTSKGLKRDLAPDDLLDILPRS